VSNLGQLKDVRREDFNEQWALQVLVDVDVRATGKALLSNLGRTLERHFGPRQGFSEHLHDQIDCLQNLISVCWFQGSAYLKSDILGTSQVLTSTPDSSGPGPYPGRWRW
jgi:hypothetical protein